MMKQWPLLIIFLCYTGLNGVTPEEEAKKDKEVEDTYVRKMYGQYEKPDWIETGELKADLRLQWKEMNKEEKLRWIMQNCTIRGQ